MSLELASRAYLSFTETHPGSSAPVSHGTSLVAVLIGAGLGCVHHAERAAAIGPEEHHDVFAGGNVAQLALDVVGAGDGFAVDFQDHVAAGDTGVIGRAAGNDVGYHHTLNVGGKLELVANIRREVLQTHAPA